jgi:2-polyprenyl-6-hydroxyphenyl methylase/3-demethylubiquinone-9 3-methyltransferase
MILEHSWFGWQDTGPTRAHSYIAPVVLRVVRELCPDPSARILDLGCGNGYIASLHARLGYRVIGVDVSEDGIALARLAYPEVEFYVCSVYEDRLAEIVKGEVDCVLALEVVEHLFYPRRLFEQSYLLLRKGGYLLISTPYHGYLKNLVISLLDGWDHHFEVERDGGHIKFFSKRTLARMAAAVGFENLRFEGAGRLPWLWKSMMLVAQKP